MHTRFHYAFVIPKTFLMKVENKILIINISLAALITAALAFITDTYPGNGFFFITGVVGIAGGIGCTLLGMLLMLRKDKSPARGYLISGIILLIIGLPSYFFLNQF